MQYKSVEDSPKELTINIYWSRGMTSILREALPYNHEENLWNWFVRTYPDLNPEYYDIYKPVKPVPTIKK